MDCEEKRFTGVVAITDNQDRTEYKNDDEDAIGTHKTYDGIIDNIIDDDLGVLKKQDYLKLQNLLPNKELDELILHAAKSDKDIFNLRSTFEKYSYEELESFKSKLGLQEFFEFLLSSH